MRVGVIMSIRMYGLGKFNTVIDSELYAICLDTSWLSDECSCEGLGWYGVIKCNSGETMNKIFAKAGIGLNKSEFELISTAIGVIIHEDTDGFIDVEYYAEPDELGEMWGSCEDICSGRNGGEYGHDDD
jgi:hypothetical protein